MEIHIVGETNLANLAFLQADHTGHFSGGGTNLEFDLGDGLASSRSAMRVVDKQEVVAHGKTRNRIVAQTPKCPLPGEIQLQPLWDQNRVTRQPPFS
jgi:hypothetical protein